MAAPADRYLEEIADPVALRIVRHLAERELSQAALVSELGVAQSVASRTLRNLRAAGIVDSDSPRGPLRLRAPHEIKSLLQAANNLAEAILTVDAEEQRRLTRRTRKAAIRSADGPPTADASTQAVDS